MHVSHSALRDSPRSALSALRQLLEACREAKCRTRLQHLRSSQNSCQLTQETSHETRSAGTAGTANSWRIPHRTLRHGCESSFPLRCSGNIHTPVSGVIGCPLIQPCTSGLRLEHVLIHLWAVKLLLDNSQRPTDQHRGELLTTGGLVPRGQLAARLFLSCLAAASASVSVVKDIQRHPKESIL